MDRWLDGKKGKKERERGRRERGRKEVRKE